jgi:perosamine synthetase
MKKASSATSATASPLLTSREPGAPAGGGFIPLCVPNVTGSEWDYIKDCLDSGWVSSVGSYVDRFERETAAAAGTGFGVATSSGTAALHVALLLAGLERDEEVIVPTLTFIASCNAVRYVGAWPTLIDVEPEHWQIDPTRVREFLSRRCRRDANGSLRNTVTGRRVRAILPVDVLGHPCDIDPLLAIAAEYDLAVVEDATEALGALYRDRKVGSTSPMSCLSFNGNKLLTTGGGGMIVTNDEALARRAKYLTTQAKDDPVEFVHGAVGFNYRLTNIQAAMGCAQLERLDEFVEAKRSIARRYAEELGQLPGLSPMREAEWARSSFWMYTIQVEPSRFGRTSRELMAILETRKIQSRPLWQPMHRSPALVGSHAEPCPVAEAAHAVCLSLPCSTNLTDDEQSLVIDAVRAAKA